MRKDHKTVAPLPRSLFCILFLIAGIIVIPPATAEESLEHKPADSFFAKFHPRKAPAYDGLLLKAGDRLAICGDSITQQKRYSRIMETYLTVCVPELKIATRQYGLNGETALGFRRRMANDCLRFRPTVATTCYGMNDYGFKPYNRANAEGYRSSYAAVARLFKESGTRVVLGSPGCVGKIAGWVQGATGTVEEHNLHLCALRNIGIEIAEKERIRFADVFWPMLVAGFEARKRFGAEYAITGQDGVHPDLAGHLVMAYSFLKSLGLNGEIGTFVMDLQSGMAIASEGHLVEQYADGALTVTSRRYPFCAGGNPDKDNSLRSGMNLVPFNRELNRLVLVVRGTTGTKYAVTWGTASRVYAASQLAEGVNLADDFPDNPFSGAFRKVDEAVAAKQAYETEQVNLDFHGSEAWDDMEGVVSRTEARRTPLVDAIRKAFVPVTHTITIKKVGA